MPPAPAPTLLLSGGIDPATPPRHGEHVARALGAQARALLADGAFQALFRSDVVSEPEAPAHAPLLESGDAEAPAPQAGAEVVLQAGLRFESLQEVLSALSDAALAGDAAGDARAELFALWMGLAGLHAVRPRSGDAQALVARTRGALRALVMHLRS